MYMAETNAESKQRNRSQNHRISNYTLANGRKGKRNIHQVALPFPFPPPLAFLPRPPVPFGAALASA
jgi:hypothetical protein